MGYIVRALGGVKGSDCVKATKIDTHMYFDILFHIRIGGILENAFEPPLWGSKSPQIQFFQRNKKSRRNSQKIVPTKVVVGCLLDGS